SVLAPRGIVAAALHAVDKAGLATGQAAFVRLIPGHMLTAWAYSWWAG
ncbi:MAG: hypothetical protein RL385_809, partial [Pseudomonadota bacterium]